MKKRPNSSQSAKIKKNYFEITAWENNSVIVGIDEVGRGCLAGPLVTAAVILPAYTTYPHLKDSKTMSPEERAKAFKWITKKCWYGIGIVHNRIVDKHNIWQSTLIAMKKALLNVIETSQLTPSAIVVDAMPLNTNDTHLHSIPVHNFCYGEKKSSSIAAASIVAKVTRDAIMDSLDCIIPGYKLTDNKGYGTAAHRNALETHKHSIIHRMSFLKNPAQTTDSQLSLATLSIFEEKNSDETGEMLCGSN